MQNKQPFKLYAFMADLRSHIKAFVGVQHALRNDILCDEMYDSKLQLISPSPHAKH